MTFAFGEWTVTTWGTRDGEQQWRARHRDGRIGYFLAARDAPVYELIELSRKALETGKVEA